MSKIQIRKGRKQDLSAVLELVKELAVFEKEPDAVKVTVEDMERDAFGEKPVFEFWVAEIEGEIAGTAITYVRYSTWNGPVMYLEDFIVSQAHRRKGIGAMLFEEVLRETARRGYRHCTWQVLDWNELAIGFYKKYGSELDGGWVNGTLTLDGIRGILS